MDRCEETAGRWRCDGGPMITYTKDQLSATLTKHLAWLRGEADGGRANLTGADLTNANLTGANLTRAVLTQGWELFRVPGLHTKMLAAIEAVPGSFDMASWHGQGECGTTHCRAGWAIVLAGDAGRALEWAIGSAAAGALITHASCPWLGKVPNFYATNEEALDDIRACAAREVEMAASSPKGGEGAT